ncbi:MAG: AraC-like DNA-binding protein [Planctomycetota bacterium]|jgi:AraC-like DNA-binding protein
MKMKIDEENSRNETRLEARIRWEKEVGIHFIEALRPFPDVIDTETNVLDPWLKSMEIRPNPRPGKCGFWYSPHSFQLKRTLISDNRMIYLQQGQGQVQVGENEKPHRFCAGDALLISPSVHHTFVADEGTPVLFFAIHFDIRLLGGVNPLELVGFPKYLPGSAETPYGTTARRMAREFSARAPGWELAIASELQSVLLYLLRYHGSWFHPLHKHGRGRQILKLLPALELANRRLADPKLRVSELAAAIAVSEVYLRRLFDEVMGMSPGTFLQRRRIEHASILLRDSERSLESIAADSGFVHMSHFFRTFKRWTQATPSQFRLAEVGI